MSQSQEATQTEDQIPQLAEQAVRRAVVDAVASGKSILVTENDVVYEVFADGSKKTLTHVLPRMHVEPGTVRSMPK